MQSISICKVKLCSKTKQVIEMHSMNMHEYAIIETFLNLLSIYQRKDGYITKGKPVQGAIQQGT